MFQMRVPILALFIGDGGSGGALGIAVADTVAMLENSWYSVISPEGCASILWRSAEGKEKAADALKLTAENMHALGLIDKIVSEPIGGAHAEPKQAMDLVGDFFDTELTALAEIPIEDLLENRYQKFRQIAQTEATTSLEEFSKHELDEESSDSETSSGAPIVPGKPGIGLPSRRTPGSPRGRRQ